MQYSHTQAEVGASTPNRLHAVCVDAGALRIPEMAGAGAGQAPI